MNNQNMNQIYNMNMVNNQLNQINMQNNMFRQFMQANMNANFQAEIMRMNMIANMDRYNSNLYYSDIIMPMTQEGVVEVLDDYFSEKNLNRDFNLRKNMNKENGNVEISFILSLNKIRTMNLSEEQLCELIDKIGSDEIEKVVENNKLYLRPKKYEQFKDRLKSIEEIEKEYNEKMNKKQQQQQQNMPMNMQPMPFMPYQPYQPYIICGQMMMAPPQQQKMKNP